MSRAWMTLAVLCGLAGSAAAQQTESARSTNIELKLGGYLPEIDSGFQTTAANRANAPYQRVFGGDSDLMFLFAFEQHLFERFGTLSAGFSLGYWSTEGSGVAAAATFDRTKMRILPLMVQTSYRFDKFEDVIPLAPVLRLGIDYYMWDITGGDGETTDFEPGKPAEGGTWGWHYAVGVHFLLDFLSPEMASDFDRDAGVNSSYFTVEYHSATVDDFGSKKSFRLGDDFLLFGIAMDM